MSTEAAYQEIKTETGEVDTKELQSIATTGDISVECNTRDGLSAVSRDTNLIATDHCTNKNVESTAMVFPSIPHTSTQCDTLADEQFPEHGSQMFNNTADHVDHETAGSEGKSHRCFICGIVSQSKLVLQAHEMDHRSGDFGKYT